PSKGAGPIKLPTNGWGCFGKVSLDNLYNQVDIPIMVPANIQRIEAAVWWPEPIANDGTIVSVAHNDISLEIVNPAPANMVVASSNGVDGVFERATTTGTVTSG